MPAQASIGHVVAASWEDRLVENSTACVLFDLDGTLVDPAGAITSGIRQALRSNGVADPGEDAVESLVGPPLRIGLAELPGVTAQNLDKIIADYRQEYAARGMAASRVYPGLRTLLRDLRASGVHVAVATAKPEPIARELIRVQGLDSDLDAIYGNDDEGGAHGTSKAHIVARALATSAVDAERTVMVGDRHYDHDAAQAHGLGFIGVLWGFAQDGEFSAVEHLAADATELAELLGLDGHGIDHTSQELQEDPDA